MKIVVTDADKASGLSIIRSLGKRGLEIAAASSNKRAIGFYSKYVSERLIYPQPTENRSAFTKWVLDTVNRGKYGALIPVTDEFIVGIMEYRDEIEKGMMLLMPQNDSIMAALDKLKTIRLAEELSIPAPQTYFFENLDELQSKKNMVKLPAVLKGRYSVYINRKGQIRKSRAFGYIYNHKDLIREYISAVEKEDMPVIEELVKGRGQGFFCLADNGEMVASFMHRRVREMNPLGSGSSCAESIEMNPILKGYAGSLLKKMNWHGVAMVEFKNEDLTNKPIIMEVNGRFWNSLPLAVKAGVDFPSLYWDLSNGKEIHNIENYKVGMQCRFLEGELVHLLHVLKGRPKNWSGYYPDRWETVKDIFNFCKPETFYYNQCSDDLLPGIADIFYFSLRTLKKTIETSLLLKKDN